ncbi:hypothetical protein [Mongoliitalea lutea]|uniref:ATP synthase I chain n=1 Tax=Mongoliitalea lutea TaxID=849756 RepID=A0A8J3G4P2_9BACT|nr:hypothetical protein [Mongoliitalea lutea]GHB30551.1 hypothetical protein GCM10008106_09310 [Mongoliitalea lutea]
MQSIKVLTVRLLIYSLIIGGLVYLLQEYIKPTWVHETVWTTISFFLILTWLTSAFSHYLIGINQENSVNIMLGALGIRFLGSLGYIGIMLFLGVENIILFVANFFVIYLFYLLFDMYGLITNLRPISR